MMKKSLLLSFALLSLLVPQLAFAGSASFTTPGTHQFTVPTYGTMSVTVSGAGGGGGGGWNMYWWGNTDGGDGAPGGYSAFGSNLIGYGGGGGQHSPQYENYGNGAAWFGARGANGGSVGGSSGAGASGGAGGYPNIRTYDPIIFLAPPWTSNQPFGGPGGNGGAATKTFGSGELVPGTTISVVVGAGGEGGTDSVQYHNFYMPGWFEIPYHYYGGNGSNGSVTISWTESPPPLPPPSPMVANKPANPINFGQIGSAAGIGKANTENATGLGDVSFDPEAYCSAPDGAGRARSANWIRNCLGTISR